MQSMEGGPLALGSAVYLDAESTLLEMLLNLALRTRAGGDRGEWSVISSGQQEG